MSGKCQYSYTTKFLFVTFCQKPLYWYLIPLLDQKILTAFNFECGQIFLSIIKSEILHNRMIVIFQYGTSNIFDHVENIFNLVKIFLNQQMNYLGMKEYLHYLLSFSAKFEAMLFALCKNEDNNTASMRIFLQVCIFFFCIVPIISMSQRYWQFLFVCWYPP